MAGSGKAVPSSDIRDLEPNANTLDEVVSSSALTTTARFTPTNPSGKTIRTLAGIQAEFDSAIENTGWFAASGSFEAGGTITERNQVLILQTAVGGDAEGYYSWGGALPKTVTASSTPAGTGGQSPSAWVYRGDATVKSEITGFGATTQEVGGAALKTTSTYNKRTQNKAVVSFIFDDGLSNAIPVIESVFDARGITCGLAINASQAGIENNRAELNYLISLQDKGYEFLSHSLTEQSVSQASSPRESLVRSELNNSYDILSEAGFNIKGFVTTQSELDPTKRFIAFEKYSYAFTIYKGQTGGLGALQDSNLVLNQLFRTNLFSVGLTEAKNIVDLAIQNGGYVQFYDHDPTQTQYVNSMPQADLENLLDYCQSQGVEILNPKDAIDKVHSSTIKGVNTLLSDRQNTINNAQYRNNLIVDTMFNDFGSGQIDDYAWSVVNQGSPTGSFSLGVTNRGYYGEAVITADTNHTADTGSIAITNTRSEFVGNDLPRRLNFSCKLRSGTPGYRNLYGTTIEVNIYRQSDDALLNSVSTEELWVDSVLRRYDISVSPATKTEIYVECIVRMTPLTTGDAATLVISKPALVESEYMEPWSQGISLQDYFTASGTYPNFSATALPSGTFTKLGIDTPVSGVDFNTNSDGTIEINTKGTYIFVANLQITDANMSDGSRLTIAAKINNSGDFLSRANIYTSPAGAVQASMTFCRHLNKGDTVDFHALQDSGSNITTEASSFSSLNITRVR